MGTHFQALHCWQRRPHQSCFSQTPRPGAQGLPSAFIPQHLRLSPPACRASRRDKCQNAQGSSTEDSEATNCRLWNTFQAFPQPSLPPRLTINCRVPQGGKNRSLRKKRDIGLGPHPCSQFGEAGVAVNVFPEQGLWDGRRRGTSPPKGAAAPPSSTLGGKPITGTPEHKTP